MTRIGRCVLVFAGFWALNRVPVAESAPPWKKLNIFRKIEADPDESYRLTEKQGPWLIMAQTFSGEAAEEQAHDLVIELRSRFKMLAYCHDLEIDLSNEVEQAPSQGYGPGSKRRYRMEKIHEIAVLVGNFSAIDDPEIRKSLKKIKSIHPKCLDLENLVREKKKDSRSLSAYRLAQQWVQDNMSDDDEAPERHPPMVHALVTKNPLLPAEFFVQKGIDRVVLDMNRGVKYSLLDCPGAYTCVVATFQGAVLIDQKRIEDVKNGGEMSSGLAKAAEDAHTLTLALREKGVEAYEFHDRYRSLVTVGSFDSMGSKSPDGKVVVNPQLREVMLTYGAERGENRLSHAGEFVDRWARENAVANIKPKYLDGLGIPFDVNPCPIETPRVGITAANPPEDREFR